MHASIRQYRSSDAAEVGRRANDPSGGFVPVVRQITGFQAWYLIDGGDGTLTTVTVCDDQSGVEQSVEKASEWVGDNAADLVEGAPNVTIGRIEAQA
jgi:hypothetical protein